MAENKNNAHNTTNSQTFFKNYLIIVSFLIVIFGILIYVTKVSQKSWNNNLRSTTQILLDEINPGEWTLSNVVKINNPLSQNAACYEARNKKNGENYKVVILRLQTMYGPIPAVFTVDVNNFVNFIGYSSVHGKVEQQLKNNFSNKRISYWQEKIPEIIKQ